MHLQKPLLSAMWFLSLRIAFSAPYADIPAMYLVPGESNLTLGLESEAGEDELKALMSTFSFNSPGGFPLTLRKRTCLRKEEQDLQADFCELRTNL